MLWHTSETTVYCKRNFCGHWETQTLGDSLYCGGLGPNPQYLWGVPVVTCTPIVPKVTGRAKTLHTHTACR